MSRLRETLRVGVSVAVVRQSDNALLLVRRGRPPAKDMWAFAGGKVEFGEPLTSAAVRELSEETGVVVNEAMLSFLRPVEIVMRDGEQVTSHYVLMCFLVEVLEAIPVAGDDAIEAGFFTIGEIRDLNVTPTTLEIAEEICAQRM
ncbi:MAG: NUDIX hydrolase [Pseudomonadota bacterium]